MSSHLVTLPGPQWTGGAAGPSASSNIIIDISKASYQDGAAQCAAQTQLTIYIETDWYHNKSFSTHIVHISTVGSKRNYYVHNVLSVSLSHTQGRHTHWHIYGTLWQRTHTHTHTESHAHTHTTLHWIHAARITSDGGWVSFGLKNDRLPWNEKSACTENEEKRGTLYIYRYTVTTRMTPALRWAARRATMFH